MSSNNGFPPMLHVSGLWKKTDKHGKTFFIGTLGSLRIFIFQNDKKNDDSPDLLLSLGQRINLSLKDDRADRKDSETSE